VVKAHDILRFCDEIVRQYNPLRIILFGSHAYGKPRRESDVDLLVIMPYRGSEMKMAVRMLTELRPAFPVDLLVRRPGDTARRYREFDPLVREALDRGKVLYEQDRAGVDGKGARGLQQRRAAVSRA
jgi:predicted nucleotidyltransferase